MCVSFEQDAFPGEIIDRQTSNNRRMMLYLCVLLAFMFLKGQSSRSCRCEAILGVNGWKMGC